MANGNGGVTGQILNALLRIEGKVGQVGQKLKDLEKFTNRINQRVDGKGSRKDVDYLKQLLNGHIQPKTNCPVMKIHVALKHNPDAELGKKVRKTSNWFAKILRR